MLLGGTKANDYTDDEFDAELEKDMDAGENPTTKTVAPGNIKNDSTDEKDQKYLIYLKSIMDEKAIETVKKQGSSVINPEGVLYMTAGSSSGSKYYDLVPRQQTYIAHRWQEDVPTYSVVDVTENSLTINTYRTDNDEKIDETFSITKSKGDTTSLNAEIKASGIDLKYEVGTMIEIPRAALTADEIASEADFFSFGTNDLTQMTFGFSRDDAGKFLNAYYDAKIYESDPFAKVDQKGVGKLMKMAIDLGRPVNPKLHIGVCGEHGGDPSSVEFFNKLGLDYVSCSPFRVPIARLAAAQSAIKMAEAK